MSPHMRRIASWGLVAVVLVGWPTTHVLLVVLKPPDASSWVFHLLLALSWAALAFEAVSLLATADVRVQQEENGEDSA